MLTEEVMQKLPCAFKGCKLSYDEHTFDVVCFLTLKRNGKSEEARDILQGIVRVLSENGHAKIVDGFAFVDVEEKFRING